MKTSKTKMRLMRILEIREMGGVLPLIVGFVLFTVLSDRFLSLDNMTNVLRTAAFTMICAIGECYLMIAGSFDISISSVYTLGGIVAGLAMTAGAPIWLSVLAALASGAVAGVMNGFFVQKLNIAPFIATLGTQFMARGVVQGITRGSPVYPLPKAFCSVGQDVTLLGARVPWVVIIAVVLSVIAAFILKFTTYGRRLYAAGGNGEAARLAGIPTSKLRFGAFVLAGVTAALTGVLMAARLGSAQTTVGTGFEMTVIAGAVIGGIGMAGGAGSVWGVALGAFFMAMITNGMTLIGISAYWQTAVTGAILIFACSLEYFRNYLKAKLGS